MKKTVAFVASLVLAIPTSFALPSVAQADAPSGKDAVNFCKAFVPWANEHWGSTLNLGNCVSYLNSGNGNANAICHLFGATPDQMGECVSSVNEYLHS